MAGILETQRHSLRRAVMMAQFRLFMRHVAASRRPIVFGPWRGEVGFEGLYWLPFIQHLRHRYNLDRNRLVAWTRGGAHVLYDMPRHVELYDQVSYDEAREEMLKASLRTGSTKQMAWTPWERSLLPRLALNAAVGGRPIVIHPRWLYAALGPFWGDRATAKLVDRWTRLTPLPMPPLPAHIQLPHKFLAVRFYARPTWDPNEEQVLWMRDVVYRAAKVQPVILLQSGGRYDDHADLLEADPARNIHTLEQSVTPQTNLAVLTAVLARSGGFIGTYGGLAQLALRMGVPVISTYTEWGGTALAHLDLSQRLSLTMQVPFHVLRPQDANHWEAVFGAVLR